MSCFSATLAGDVDGNMPRVRRAISGTTLTAVDAISVFSSISDSSAPSARLSANRAHAMDCAITRTRSTSTPLSSVNVCAASSQTHIANSTRRLAFTRTAARLSPVIRPPESSDSSLDAVVAASTLGGAWRDLSAYIDPIERVAAPRRASSPQTNVVVIDEVDERPPRSPSVAPTPSASVSKKRLQLRNSANRVAGFCDPTPRCTDDPEPTPPSSPRRKSSPKCPSVLAGACAATSVGAASNSASSAAGASLRTSSATCVSAAPAYKINVFANGASPSTPNAGTTPRPRHSLAARLASLASSANRSPTRSIASPALARTAPGYLSHTSNNPFNPSHRVFAA
mmetsp:Transcript_6016/g.23840  ORF Transcript_6016/g.23840 Transcript_6016/m.23840 type:complete len:341 (-) Transcript_6016:380-1402(-)